MRSGPASTPEPDVPVPEIDDIKARVTTVSAFGDFSRSTSR
jgi:hypothetical protein